MMWPLSIEWNIYLISGSTINSDSYLGDTDFPQNREIEYNYSNGTLLNENSIVSENTKLMKGSIINDEEITNIYVEDDIHIYNTSTIEIGSVILNGSLIKKDSIINNRKYTNDELHAKGINDSAIHVDFMIGTKDLDIVAHLKDGSEVQIFKNGNWAN